MNDSERLNIIHEYGLRKGEDDPNINMLIDATAALLNMPIAYVSIIDEYQQFFKARLGFTFDSTNRTDAFCNLVIEKEDVVLIENTQLDPKLSSNPLVIGEPYIRFYAGVPLKIRNITIGAVCVLDTKPRTFNQAQLLPLKKLSQHIAIYLNLIREQNHFHHEHELIDNSPAVLLKWSNFRGFNLTYVSSNIETLFGVPTHALINRDALLEDFIDPLTLDNFVFLLSNHRNGVESADTQFRLINPSDKVFWVKMISKAFYDDMGKLDSIHALLIDYTSHRFIEQKLLDTNQHMRLLLEASDLGTWDYDIVRDINKINPFTSDMVGITNEFFDTSRYFWRGLIHPEDRVHVENAYQALLSDKTNVLLTAYRIKHTDGHWLWLETYGKVVERDDKNVPVRIAGTHRDVTEKKRMELGDQKQRHLLSFINKAMGIYLQDHDLSGACRKILDELTDIADSEFAFIGQMRKQEGNDVLYIHAITELSWNHETQVLVEMYHNRNLYFRHFDNLFGSVITTEKQVISNHPHTHPASKGTPKGHPKIYKFMGLPIKLQGKLVGMIGLANKLEDYTDSDALFLQPLVDALASLYYSVNLAEAREYAEEQLKMLAMTDPLTGLFNRRAFEETYCNDYRSRSEFVVAILDIDHFKLVNDNYGHPIGDIVLQRVATLLQQSLKKGDIVARIGGEEFAMILTTSDSSDGKEHLESLREKVDNNSMIVDMLTLKITVSIGAVRNIPSQHWEIDDLIRLADQALYKAKNNGRNRVYWTRTAFIESNNE